jgi:hypothetical protein
VLQQAGAGPSDGDYDGARVVFKGGVSDRDVLAQARAERDWLRNLLYESTGKRYPVRAAVLLPGWYVERTGEAKTSDIWVLNPKALPAFIEQEPLVLQNTDVALVSSRLITHIVR